MKLFSILILCFCIIFASAPRCDTASLVLKYLEDSSHEMMGCHEADSGENDQNMRRFHMESSCDCVTSRFVVMIENSIQDITQLVNIILQSYVLEFTLFLSQLSELNLSVDPPPPRY